MQDRTHYPNAIQAVRSHMDPCLNNAGVSNYVKLSTFLRQADRKMLYREQNIH